MLKKICPFKFRTYINSRDYKRNRLKRIIRENEKL